MKGYTFWITVTFVGCLMWSAGWFLGHKMEPLDWFYIGAMSGGFLVSLCLFLENVVER